MYFRIVKCNRQYPFQSEESTEEEESFDEEEEFDEVEMSEEEELPAEDIEESSSVIEETNEPGVATLRATWCRFCTLFLFVFFVCFVFFVLSSSNDALLTFSSSKL